MVGHDQLRRALPGQWHEDVFRVGQRQGGDAVGHGGRVPKRLHGWRAAANAHRAIQLGQDEEPAHQRHRQQHQRDRVADRIGLRPEVRQREVAGHGCLPA